MKKFGFRLFFLFIAVILLSVTFDCYAAIRLPEINYPPVPIFGAEPPQIFTKKINEKIPGYTPEMALPLSIQYFYYLALFVSGLITLGAIVYGGILYLISTGNAAKMAAAREQILGSLLGLIILVSSYLILTAINPQLAIFSISAPEIEKCDCTQPEGDSSQYCKTYCQKTEPVSEEIPTYIEIPLGRITERVIKASVDAKDAAEEVKKAADELEKKASELKKATEECEICTSINTTCISPANCSGGTCPYNGSTECPNRDEIEDRREAVNDATEYLGFLQENLLRTKADLERELFNLEIAESLMRDSLSLPIHYEAFIALEKKQVRKLNHWTDIDITVDPLKDIREKIAPEIPGDDNSEDPATFYILEEANKDLIQNVEGLTPTGLPIGPEIPISGFPCQLTQEMIDSAKFASSKTHVRASLLLALFCHESGLNQFAGTSHYPNTFDACGKVTWKRQFEQIWEELTGNLVNPYIISGRTFTIYTMPLSAPGVYAGVSHCGGAMGPSQLMPFTWLMYQDFVKQYTEKTVVSPWDFTDAFTCGAVHLRLRPGIITGAPTQECAKEAASICAYWGSCHGGLAGRIVGMANTVADIIGENHCFSANNPPLPPSEGWQWPIKTFTVLSSNAQDHAKPSRGSAYAWDFTAPCGTDIYPAKAGTVIKVVTENCPVATGYGCEVRIDHGGGWTTRYGHMIPGSITVSIGDTVDINTKIGQVGCTGRTSFGPHVHLEILYNYRQVDPATVFSNSPPYRPFCINLGCDIFRSACTKNPEEYPCFNP